METPVEFQSKLDGKVLKSQTREVISNVMEFMEREGKADRFIIDPRKVRERVSAAVGVSQRTLTRINAEKRKLKETNSSFETPNKKRTLPKKVTGLDDFDLGMVRRAVNSFYLNEKSLPTLKKIRSKLQTEIKFSGSTTSVRRILKKMGYRWRKTKTNKHILMESQDVAYKRFVYLKRLQEYRSENRPIVFSDEFYIDFKGERLIFVHAGGEMGFINNCLSMRKTSLKTGDCDDNVNSESYIKWLTQKLIPNLPPRSIVVVDDAACRNKQIDKSPMSNSRKDEMRTWLLEKNIPFSSSMLKVELYELIKIHKSTHKRYVIDEIVKAHGHDILRLPPCHPELNAIKFIWTDVKNWIAAHNASLKFHDIEDLSMENFATISADDWIKQCRNVEKFEQQFIGNQALIEDVIESFVINLGAESSADEGSELSEDGSDVGNLSGTEESE